MRLEFEDAASGNAGEILPHDGSARLVADFLSRAEADEIMAKLMDEVPWAGHQLVLFGKKMIEPRLSAWIGDDGASYAYSGIERRPTAWTPTLADLRARCEDATSSPFNSVLANLYRDGDDSMGWHADDEPELGSEPVIASLSFGAERRFDFKHRVSGETVSVVLPHGSLLVMSGASQAGWKHRIARTKAVTTPRINLTYRFVHPRPSRGT